MARYRDLSNVARFHVLRLVSECLHRTGRNHPACKSVPFQGIGSLTFNSTLNYIFS